MRASAPPCTLHDGPELVEGLLGTVDGVGVQRHVGSLFVFDGIAAWTRLWVKTTICRVLQRAVGASLNRLYEPPLPFL